MRGFPPRFFRTAAFYWCCRCAENSHKRGMCIDEAFWRSLCAAIGQRFPDAVDSPSFVDQEAA